MQIGNLIFLRHGKFSLPYKDPADMPFSVLTDLGLGTLNPLIDRVFARERIQKLSAVLPFAEVKKIIVSPSPRCQETADILLEYMNAPVRETSDYLKEVPFDLAILNKTMNVQNDMKNNGIAAVNTAVFKAMLTGDGCEPIAEIYGRVEKLFASPPPEKTIFLTHDFLMRIIEIFIRRNRVSFQPISQHELEGTHRNGYLCGFATSGKPEDIGFVDNIR